MNRVCEVANWVQLMSRSSEHADWLSLAYFFVAHFSPFVLFISPLSLPLPSFSPLFPNLCCLPLSLGVNFIKEYEWEWVSEHSGGSQYLINSCRTLTPWRPWQQIITFSWRNQVQLQQHLCAVSCCSCNCQKAFLVGSWRSWDISLSVPPRSLQRQTDRQERGGGTECKEKIEGAIQTCPKIQ